MDKRLVPWDIYALTNIGESWWNKEGEGQVENPISRSRHAHTLGSVSQRKDF